MYLGLNKEPEIQPFNGLYYIKLTPDINGNYKKKIGPLLSNTWKYIVKGIIFLLQLFCTQY